MCESRKSRTKPHHQRPDCCFWKIYGVLLTVCCIVQKKLLFVCERRFRIALLVGGCIILLYSLVVFLAWKALLGWKRTSTWSFFCLEEKKCRRRHICKKRACRLAVSVDIFFKEGTTHYTGKNRNLLPCKKKIKKIKTSRLYFLGHRP